MSKLHVLPNGNGIELSRVVAVHYDKSRSGEMTNWPARIRIEYAGHSVGVFTDILRIKEITAVSMVEFDTDETAIKFRDEFIALINSQSDKKND